VKLLKEKDKKTKLESNTTDRLLGNIPLTPTTLLDFLEGGLDI
jgi:hypothetical protein